MVSAARSAQLPSAIWACRRVGLAFQRSLQSGWLADTWRKACQRNDFKIIHAAVKLFPLSVAIVVALSLFLAPVLQVFEVQECDMFGVSTIEAMNCHGCCAQMKYCSVQNHGQQSQPAFPGSNNRPDSGCDDILAVVSRYSVLLYALPEERENYHPSIPETATPVFSSLARLCIRLI
jgi:hypothetical protein